MKVLSLKQFVPSSVCLQCDGCCRFKSEDSQWRPKTGVEDQRSLGVMITEQAVWDAQGYIKTIQSCGEHLCRFFKAQDHSCKVYAHRPLECSLYPFILSRRNNDISVQVHLACPFVQDQHPSCDFEAYVAYLKEFFARPDIRQFLADNQGMFHDYTPFSDELLHLFDLPSL